MSKSTGWKCDFGCRSNTHTHQKNKNNKKTPKKPKKHNSSLAGNFIRETREHSGVRLTGGPGGPVSPSKPSSPGKPGPPTSPCVCGNSTLDLLLFIRMNNSPKARIRRKHIHPTGLKAPFLMSFARENFLKKILLFLLKVDFLLCMAIPNLEDRSVHKSPLFRKKNPFCFGFYLSEKEKDFFLDIWEGKNVGRGQEIGEN